MIGHHGRRGGVRDLVSHVGAGVVACHTHRVAHGYLLLVAAARDDGRTGFPVGVVVQALEDEDRRGCDDCSYPGFRETRFTAAVLAVAPTT